MGEEGGVGFIRFLEKGFVLVLGFVAIVGEEKIFTTINKGPQELKNK